MVYIRNKRVKGIDYAYLVKSNWDALTGTSKQITVKYLGKSSNVTLQDIPVQYRNDAKVLSFLSRYSQDEHRKKEVLFESLLDSLLALLSAGDVGKAAKLYQDSKRAITVEEFYDMVIKPAMYEIGRRWKNKEITIAEEHVCTNVAAELISALNEGSSPHHDKNEKILICSPQGELHSLGAAILESMLKKAGYKVSNATPSVPTQDIIRHAKEMDPDLIMVSITLPDNIGAGQRLVTRLRSISSVRLMVGGQAVAHLKGGFGDAIIVDPQSNSLNDTLRIIRSTLRNMNV
jgi:methanogenic corrinoid protein MtbC1